MYVWLPEAINATLTSSLVSLTHSSERVFFAVDSECNFYSSKHTHYYSTAYRGDLTMSDYGGREPVKRSSNIINKANNSIRY